MQSQVELESFTEHRIVSAALFDQVNLVQKSPIRM